MHNVNLHTGINHTLALLKENYWIIDGRNEIRRVLHACVKCFKAEPKILTYPMGDLPKFRVNAARPFRHCGIDFGGPIMIKEGGIRSKRKTKSYIAVFVCLASKAIHIELVTSLSTEGFLAALKRCMARRGKIAHIWSDNATNFVGAANELREIYKFLEDDTNQRALITATSLDKINWHFIPPKSPHFGGLWEAGIKSVKRLLKRTIGNACLTFEELYTCLVQIEAILNSRPLTPLSPDPNDLNPLTPSHFLIGDSLTTNEDLDVKNVKFSHLSRWQYIDQLKQHFWARWNKEYLSNLQQRTKWFEGNYQSISINDLVLIKEDNLPPLCWCLGRIQAIHTGEDGVPRAATVRTTKGLFKRTVCKLCKLPT